MSWRFKASKYKNAAPKLPKPDEWVRDLNIGSYQVNGQVIKASASFMAFNADVAGNFDTSHHSSDANWFHSQEAISMSFPSTILVENPRTIHCFTPTLILSLTLTSHRLMMASWPLVLRMPWYWTHLVLLRLGMIISVSRLNCGASLRMACQKQ